MSEASDTVMISARLSNGLVSQLDSLASRECRSRTGQLEHLLRQALTGPDRASALQAIAEREIEASNAPRERVRNAGELLDTTDGEARVQSLGRVAAANLNLTFRKR